MDNMVLTINMFIEFLKKIVDKDGDLPVCFASNAWNQYLLMNENVIKFKCEVENNLCPMVCDESDLSEELQERIESSGIKALVIKTI